MFLEIACELMVVKQKTNFWHHLWKSVLVPLQVALALSSLTAEGSAQELSEVETKSFSIREIEFFENKVRPLFSEHCIQCHGANAQKIRGGLRLTSRDEMLGGGDTGPAIVPGHPEESLLISSVQYEDYEMPPKGKLKDSEIDILVQWIKMGAPDPRQSQPLIKSEPMNLEAGKKFWSFSPLRNTQHPTTGDRNWPRNDIDCYLLAKMESQGIEPVEDASRESLLRRIYLAVIGLPPTVSQLSLIHI